LIKISYQHGFNDKNYCIESAGTFANLHTSAAFRPLRTEGKMMIKYEIKPASHGNLATGGKPFELIEHKDGKARSVGHYATQKGAEVAVKRRMSK
jgi:hypothetical protein